MDQNLINKTFTAKLQELLVQGYVVDAEEMSGTQGELAKMRFVKGGKFYVLFAESVSLPGRYSSRVKPDAEPWGEAIDIVFAEAKEGYRKGHTLWLSHCQRLDVTRLYVIGDRYYKAHTYTADRDEAMTAWLKHKAREAQHYAPSTYDKKELTSDAAITAAFHMLRRYPGFRTLRKSNISSVCISGVCSRNTIEAVVRKTGARYSCSHVLFSAHDAHKH